MILNRNFCSPFESDPVKKTPALPAKPSPAEGAPLTKGKKATADSRGKTVKPAARKSALGAPAVKGRRLIKSIVAPMGAETESDVDQLVLDGPDVQRLVIVGIGASAGGLEALKELIAGLTHSEFLTYVVAQHLSPSHSSLLRDLLRPSTDLAVKDVTDRLIPQPNTIYITPPNHDVEYGGGMLRLVKPKATVGPKPSVDHFFTSLAEHYGENTVGIILSGTGSDGALGVRAIKAAGGVALIQDPQTAKYDGMPRAAIQTGSADMVLPATKVGDVLQGLIALPASMRLPLPDEEVSGTQAKINSVVKRHTGFDLGHYKSATVNRRLSRRMALHKLATLEQYAEHVRLNQEEARQLAKDVLISVTSFFRDPQAFETLREQLGKMVDESDNESVIRVWVPACATGEEAYGIAILMSDVIREKNRRSDFLIFATDLDTDALAYARAGNYPDTAVEALSKPIRDRYFEQTGRTYQVKKSLRQNMVFAAQNVIEDPPFSRVDLISCRNLLIYFNRDVQRRVLEIFHYALRSGGRLFLGKSESIELHKELFGDLDKGARIYLRRETAGPTYAVPLRSRRGPGQEEEPSRKGPEFPNTTYKLLTALAERYCPPAVVINDLDEALHFTGELRPFLRFPRGSADMKVFDLVPDEMRGEIRALVHRCRRERATQTGTVISIAEGNGTRSFVPVVTPLQVDKTLLLALSFEPAEKPLHASVARTAEDGRDNVIIEELEKELASTRQHLQTVVEELETSNEELMSQSEELQSSNEELQSTNEELQTSNEELQSTNEELLTVNDELQSKSTELSTLAADLQSVKESLDFPLLVIDERMHLKHFNRTAERFLAKEGLQIDMSLVSVDWSVDIMSLITSIKKVIRDGRPAEVPLSDDQGRVFTVRVMPTLLMDEEHRGAVITFLDISTQAAAEQSLRDRETMYRLNFEMSTVGMAVLKRNLQFLKANSALCRMLKRSEKDLINLSLTEVIQAQNNKEWRINLDELAHGERTSVVQPVTLTNDAGDAVSMTLFASLAKDATAAGGSQISIQLIADHTS